MPEDLNTAVDVPKETPWACPVCKSFNGPGVRDCSGFFEPHPTVTVNAALNNIIAAWKDQCATALRERDTYEGKAEAFDALMDALWVALEGDTMYDYSPAELVYRLRNQRDEAEARVRTVEWDRCQVCHEPRPLCPGRPVPASPYYCPVHAGERPPSREFA